MCTRKSKNRSDHATFHVVFIHFEPDEKKEAKRRRLKNPSLGHGKNPAAHLTVVGIEKVLPHNDEELLRTRESLWINNYDSVQFGANTRS